MKVQKSIDRLRRLRKDPNSYHQIYPEASGPNWVWETDSGGKSLQYLEDLKTVAELYFLLVDDANPTS